MYACVAGGGGGGGGTLFPRTAQPYTCSVSNRNIKHRMFLSHSDRTALSLVQACFTKGTSGITSVVSAS